MEASERPSKIRKLSHGKQELLDQLPDLYQKPSHPAISDDQETTAPLNIEANATESIDQNTDHSSDIDLVTEPLQNIKADTSTPPTKQLSKKQLKKLLKKQEWEAGKEDRRAKRREKAKERKERKREQREQEIQQRIANGEPDPQLQRPNQQRPVRLPVTFLIDCGFDDKMVDKERISLGAQLTRAYSYNSKASYQAHLVVSSWGGLLKERFDTVLGGQHQNWKGIQFLEADFVQAAEDAKHVMAKDEGDKLDGMFKQYARNNNANGKHTSKVENTSSVDVGAADALVARDNANETHQPSDQSTDALNQLAQPVASTTTIEQPSSEPLALPTPLSEPEIVYLTSESPNTLTRLSPYSTYIIGGIVDKNRHKGLCYKLACDRGIKTAKLPIGEFMEMQSRYVLATNHVVEIMVQWLECGNWGESFVKVIPKRKGGKLKERGADSKDGKAEEEAVKGDASKNEDATAQAVGGDELDSEQSDTEPVPAT